MFRMIKKLKIKQYKQFKDLEINFHKGINVIAGANGTGKTTLFNMLKEGLSGKSKGFRLEKEGKANKLDSVFADGEVMGLEVNDNHLSMGERIFKAFKDMTQRTHSLLVFDSPFARIDRVHAAKLVDLLKQQSQVILFLSEPELENSGMKADYRLKDNGKIEASKKR